MSEETAQGTFTLSVGPYGKEEIRVLRVNPKPGVAFNAEVLKGTLDRLGFNPEGRRSWKNRSRSTGFALPLSSKHSDAVVLEKAKEALNGLSTRTVPVPAKKAAASSRSISSRATAPVKKAAAVKTTTGSVGSATKRAEGVIKQVNAARKAAKKAAPSKAPAPTPAPKLTSTSAQGATQAANGTATKAPAKKTTSSKPAARKTGALKTRRTRTRQTSKDTIRVSNVDVSAGQQPVQVPAYVTDLHETPAIKPELQALFTLLVVTFPTPRSRTAYEAELRKKAGEAAHVVFTNIVEDSDGDTLKPSSEPMANLPVTLMVIDDLTTLRAALVTVEAFNTPGLEYLFTQVRTA